MGGTLSSFPTNAAMFIKPTRLVLSAWTGHVPFGAWLVAEAKPRIFVELGSHTGMSYAALCQTVASEHLDTKCYAVDTWQGDEHAGYYGDDVFFDLAKFNEDNFANFSRLMRMSFDEAAEYFAEGTVDLLHIDGLHTYEAVRHDFETWLPKLSDRAIVLFHDTNVRERGFGVWQYWSELTKQYPGVEFDHSAGLGVLLVGKNQSPAVTRLLEIAKESKLLQYTKEMFANLGDSVLRRWELDRARCEQFQEIQRLREQVATLSVELREKIGLNEELQREVVISKALQEVAAMTETIKTLSEDNEALRGKLSHSEEVARQLANSVSYRMTRPLRLVRGLFRH